MIGVARDSYFYSCVCALPKQTSEVLVRLKLDYYRVLFRVRLMNFSGYLLRTLSAGSLLSSYREQFLNFSYLEVYVGHVLMINGQCKRRHVY